MTLKVYVASKLRHADLFKSIAVRWKPEIDIISSWISLVETIPDTSAFAQRFWQIDVNEVKESDAVLLYAEEKDHLRGALVEVGVALGQNIPVVVVGTHHDCGTWRWHPGVYQVCNLDDAKLLLSLFESKPYLIKWFK